MRTAGRIVWIDDNPERATTAKQLKATFINVRGKDLAGVVSQLFQKEPPRMVILDHILDKTSSSDPLLQRGSTIAEGLKERWPACPVVGVTNADRVDDIDIRTKATYDDLLPFVDFSRYFDRISGIANTFTRIRKLPGPTINRLIGLLRAPAEEAGRLSQALPDDIKHSPADAGTASRLYRWVNYLLERPGFLYPELWASTLLGLKVDGFRSVLPRFEAAQYGGIFFRPQDNRWWMRSLTEILYGEFPPGAGELSWHVGRKLLGPRGNAFSKCRRCRGDYPEIVAYEDASSSAQYAMHLKCTELHPKYKRELYYEDIRIMRGD